MSHFIYLLNAMENAAQASDPSTAGYGLARRAVLEYVEKLEAPASEIGEYICKCGVRVVPHRCSTRTEF